MWDRGDRAEMVSTVSASLPREKRRSVPETLADSFHVQKGRVTPDSLCGGLEAIHDRDPLYTDKFESILKTTGVESVKLPPRSPNLNAHAERFIRSIKEQCLDHLILSSEDQLHYVLAVP